MKVLESLQEIAFNNHINIHNTHFSDNKKACCLHYKEYKSIGIDNKKINSTAEKKEILAEEVGHYQTGSLYMLESTQNHTIYKNNIIKCEGMAKKWQIKKLLPFDKLEEAVNNGLTEIFELAEYFNLSNTFIEKAIKYYTENKGLSLK